MSQRPAQPGDCFRVAAELRRSAVYVMVCALPLAAFAFWVSRFVQQRSTLEAASISAVLATLGLAMIVPLRWTLRVEHEGIARRVLLGWDRWRWSDFAAGRIRKQYPCTFVDPERPWWRRKLRFGFMAGDDVKVVLERINAHYRLPPPPQLPHALRVKYGFRRSAALDATGVHVLASGEPTEYLWSDVRRVHITRIDPIRRDFKTCEVFLPDREIALKIVSHQGGTSPSWRGATPEMVSEFLSRHVPAERIDVDIQGERPARREDAEKQLKQAREAERALRILFRVFTPVLAALLVWTAVAESVWKAVVMTAMCTVPPGAVFISICRLSRKHTRELEKLVASYDNGDADEE